MMSAPKIITGFKDLREGEYRVKIENLKIVEKFSVVALGVEFTVMQNTVNSCTNLELTPVGEHCVFYVPITGRKDPEEAESFARCLTDKDVTERRSSTATYSHHFAIEELVVSGLAVGRLVDVIASLKNVTWSKKPVKVYDWKRVEKVESTWTVRDGTIIPLKDMTDLHVQNALKMVLRKSADYNAYCDQYRGVDISDWFPLTPEEEAVQAVFADSRAKLETELCRRNLPVITIDEALDEFETRTRLKPISSAVLDELEEKHDVGEF